MPREIAQHRILKKIEQQFNPPIIWVDIKTRKATWYRDLFSFSGYYRQVMADESQRAS
jgi:hypothetical protein